MNTLATSAKTSMTAGNTAEANLKLAIINRQMAFKPISSLFARVMSALVSTDTSTDIDNQVKSLYRKLQGRRLSPYKTEEELLAAEAAGTPIKERSTSQMGFNTRLDNLEKFIKLLTTIPQYAPNEAELKLTALNTLLADLKAKNTAVVSAQTQLNLARITRNEVLYKDLTGLVDIAYDSKVYLKSLYGHSSPQFKKVSKLVFTKRV